MRTRRLMHDNRSLQWTLATECHSLIRNLCKRVAPSEIAVTVRGGVMVLGGSRIDNAPFSTYFPLIYDPLSPEERDVVRKLLHRLFWCELIAFRTPLGAVILSGYENTAAHTHYTAAHILHRCAYITPHNGYKASLRRLVVQGNRGRESRK